MLDLSLFEDTEYNNNYKKAIFHEIERTIQKFPGLKAQKQFFLDNNSHVSLFVFLKGKIPCTNRNQDVEMPIIIRLPLNYPNSPPIITFPQIKERFNVTQTVDSNGNTNSQHFIEWHCYETTLINFLDAAISYFSIDKFYPYIRESPRSQVTLKELEKLDPNFSFFFGPKTQRSRNNRK